jgi:endonuclease/exonuclease/phosphatase family metal-dependent hydrolase
LLWVNLLSVAIVLGPLMGFCLPLAFGGLDKSAPRLRVLTANGGGASGERLGQIIAMEKPDIVALQEFNGEALSELLGPGWHRTKLYGVSILSRFPLSETAGFSGSSVGRFGNVAVRVSAETPFGPVWICNLHLNTPRWGFEELAITRHGIQGPQAIVENTTLRDDESRQIRAWVDEVKGPKIILGDMNMPIESAIYRRYWSSFTDAYSAAGFGYGLTKFSRWFGVRIDHVLVNDSIRVTKCRVAGPTGGDHRPVIAELEFDAS